MNRPSVDPAFTFGLSLAISLVLWYPTLRGTMAVSYTHLTLPTIYSV